MTTTVVVKANHGWDVEVTALNPRTNEDVPGHPKQVVAKGGEQTFYVHSGVDLRIHEIPPAETPVVE